MKMFILCSSLQVGMFAQIGPLSCFISHHVSAAKKKNQGGKEEVALVYQSL